MLKRILRICSFTAALALLASLWFIVPSYTKQPTTPVTADQLLTSSDIGEIAHKTLTQDCTNSGGTLSLRLCWFGTPHAYGVDQWRAADFVEYDLVRREDMSSSSIPGISFQQLNVHDKNGPLAGTNIKAAYMRLDQGLVIGTVVLFGNNQVFVLHFPNGEQEDICMQLVRRADFNMKKLTKGA